MPPTNSALLRIQELEVSYAAVFEEPAFDLFARWAQFQASVFSHLKRFNLNVADIKVESTSANPADFCVACWLFGYRAVVRYRLDRVEIWTNNKQEAWAIQGREPVLSETLDALRAVAPTVRIATHRLVTALHVSPTGGEWRETINPLFSPQQQQNKKYLPSGASFVRDLGPGEGSVVVERSMRIRDGLFVKIVAEYPGSIREEEIGQRAFGFVREVAADLHLPIEGM